MKATISVLIAVLMVVFGVLAMISSGYEYAAEKLFYRAIKASQKMDSDVDADLPKLSAYVEGNLRKILTKHPESSVAKEAHLSLAEFYLNQEKYIQALDILYDIANTYSEDKSALARMHFLKGTVFEKQNQWEKALHEYTILRQDYIDNPLALQVPLHIGDYYRQEKNFAQADEAYNQAVVFYKRMERENRGQARGYAAANLLMRAYLKLEQYEQAGEVVENIVHLYPKLLPLMQQLEHIDYIFIKKLNKPEKALQLYKDMQVKTDNSELLRTLRRKIKVLEAQK